MSTLGRTGGPAEASAAAAPPLGADRRLGMLVARLGEEPLPFQLLVVELDEGRPTHEARPGVEAEPAGDHGKDEDERELEDRSGEQQPEEADARPEHPLLQRDERGIAAGAPRP